MRWLLAGYCGLALINVSVALNQALMVTQKPRFYGMKTGRSVGIYCLHSPLHLAARVQWYKAHEYDVDVEKRRKIQAEQRIEIRNKNLTEGAYLYIHDLRIEDNGVYFCKINKTWGSGTELQVARPVNLTQALYRTKMKDGLIILQGLLLAVCIAAILLRKQTLLEKRDSIYEEPETDHIYEGLAIETCGGGLYEELSVYAQAEGAEAPWE
ncbi:B-cell antigen receptor complex-associated protein beta chain [Enoplosus armatus]|uniref:B-cell antigen receptor complex-associated protein beta chain n=1 Tax=Enoplosus armatus TaxID=215367 RepID=UPI0039969242